MSIYAFGNTSKCNQKFNEDFYYVSKIGDYIVLAVADGNGGLNGSVNPGALAITLITDFFKHLIKPTTSIKDISASMELGMFFASRGFLAVNAVDERYANMYASLTVAIIEDVSLNMVVGSVGNTEIRLFRNGEYSRITTLHSEAYDLMKKGEISDEDIYLHPKRGLVTSALGVFDTPKIDVFERQLMKEDILLFATDGLYRVMNPGTVLQLLADNSTNIQKAVNQILKEADDNECPDNATLIVGYVQDDNGITEQTNAYTSGFTQPSTPYSTPSYPSEPSITSSSYDSNNFTSDYSMPSVSQETMEKTADLESTKKKKKKYLYY